MRSLARTGTILTTLLVCATVGLPAATAASPSDHASCAAQLDQGGTPHGISQSDPGFLGQFTAQEARTAPGAVGTGTSGSAQQHGDLFSCLPGS